jgi:hypothetical protein
MYCGRVDLTWCHQLVDLGDGDASRHGGQWVEVHRCLVEDEVAVGVTAHGVDEREVGVDRFLPDIAFAAELANLLGG